MPKFLTVSHDYTSGYEPWVIDTGGSDAYLLRDFNPGLGGGIDSRPTEMVSFGAGAIFIANDQKTGQELWYTDGSSKGTYLLSDIAPGLRGSSPSQLVPSGSEQVYFVAGNLDYGREIWVTDGSPDGTRMIADISFGEDGSEPYGLIPYRDGVLLQTRDKGGVWFVNDTGATELNEPGGGFGYADVAVFDDNIFFNRPSRDGSELWKSDGTPEGTKLLFGNDNPFGIYQIGDIVATDGGLYFSAESRLGDSQLFYSDGTVEGTAIVSDGLELGMGIQASDSHLFYHKSPESLWSVSKSNMAQKLSEHGLFFLVDAEIADGVTLYRQSEGGGYKSALMITDGTTAGTKEIISGDFLRVLHVEGEMAYVSFNVGDKQIVTAVDFDGNLVETFELPTMVADSFVLLAAEETGNSKDNRMIGGVGDDVFFGKAGNDFLNGRDGNDKLFGGSGRDKLVGGGNNDFLNGGAGSDLIIGGQGSDILQGGQQQDKIFGGSGRDSLIGQKGKDELTGGGGADVFVFDRGDGRDTIFDFEVGEDVISIGRGASRLRQLDFEQQGDDVLMKFRNVEVTVEDITVVELRVADNFLFT